MANRSLYLSEKDKEFLLHSNNKSTPAELSELLDKSEIAIKEFLDANKVAYPIANTVEEKIKFNLYSKHFWKNELPAQLTKKEVAFFEEQWIDYVSQFGGDILTSEEFELKDLIMQDVLKNRELSESKTLRLRREKFQKEVSSELAKSRARRDMDFVNMMDAKIAALSENILAREKAFKDLVAQQDKIRKNLTKIRTQRTEDIDKAQVDFSTCVKILETNMKEREAEALQAEILKKAMQKSYEDLGEYKKYANDQLDKPILNSETILKTE